MAVGRAWAGYRPAWPDTDKIAGDAAFFGLDLPPAEEPAPLEVWSGFEPAVRAFLTVAGQWRTAGGMGGISFLGLDYTAVERGLSLAGTTLTPEEFMQLRLIEAGAKEELNRGR